MDSPNSLLIGYYTLLSYSYSQRHIQGSWKLQGTVRCVLHLHLQHVTCVLCGKLLGNDFKLEAHGLRERRAHVLPVLLRYVKLAKFLRNLSSFAFSATGPRSAIEQQFTIFIEMLFIFNIYKFSVKCNLLLIYCEFTINNKLCFTQNI